MWQDKDISKWILENISQKNETIGQIAKYLSNACEMGLLWIIIMIILMIHYYIKNKKVNFYFLIVLIPILSVWIFCEHYLKVVNMRPRPYQEIEAFKVYMNVIDYKYPKGASFPSGHSMVAFASAFVIAKFNKKLAPYAFILALCVAFSRLVLGAHYLSDVLAGSGIGLATGAISCAIADFLNPKIMNKIYKKEKIKHEIR